MHELPNSPNLPLSGLRKLTDYFKARESQGILDSTRKSVESPGISFFINPLCLQNSFLVKKKKKKIYEENYLSLRCWFCCQWQPCSSRVRIRICKHEHHFLCLLQMAGDSLEGVTENRFCVSQTGCSASTGRRQWGSYSHHYRSSLIHGTERWHHSRHTPRARGRTRNAPRTIGS